MPGQAFPAVEERQMKSVVENNAKNTISSIVARKAELKDKKEQFESMLLENETYRNASEQMKEFQKIKADAKKKALKDPEVATLEQEIKDISREVSDKQLTLFDYLLQYKEETGKNTIQDNTGQTYDITVSAKIKI